MLKGLFLLNTDAYEKIYGEIERVSISEFVDMYVAPQTSEMVQKNLSVLAKADVIFSGWGMIKLDKVILDAAPNLQAVFYGSGSIRYFATELAWERGIVITSAYAANAVPVVEYTLAQILFSLKRGWYYAYTVKKEGKYPDKTPVPGGFGSTVGIISLGMIGRMVVERLRSFDVNIIAYDPFVSEEQGHKLGVEMCSLDEVFTNSDVVSLHTPLLPETVGLITGQHLASLRYGASFINTARGAIVREIEMIKVLQHRPDLYAILDVTYPEPPEQGSLLYTLPNVILTPHIAGSMFNECRRMGHYMVEELKRYVNGDSLKWNISREQAKLLA